MAAAILLDLGGTVWDSWPLYARLIAAAASTETDMVLAALRRRPAARLLRAAGVTPAHFDALCRAPHPGISLYPGMRQTLRALQQRGMPRAIVTGLPHWMADPMLARTGVGDLVGAVVTYPPPGGNTAHADALRQALRSLDVPASARVWYVGDRAVDAAAATRAGVSFAWAAYGYGHSRPKQADTVLTSPDGIATL